MYELAILLNDELDNVDVLCCTEHWLSESEIKCLQLQNYTLWIYYCHKNYKNGGLAKYMKKNLSHIEKTQTYYLNQEKDFELVVVPVHSDGLWRWFSVIGARQREVGRGQRFWPRSYRRGDASVAESADVIFAPLEYILSFPSRSGASLKTASPPAVPLINQRQVRFRVFTRATLHEGK